MSGQSAPYGFVPPLPENKSRIYADMSEIGDTIGNSGKMYTMREISDALTIYREMKDKLTYEGVISWLKDGEAEKFTDIMMDLNLIKEVVKPKPWYDPEPAWSRTTEYIWVWTEDE